MVLLIAATVCVAVLAGGATIAALAIWRPELELTKAINSIRDVIGTLLGLMSGFLAGSRSRLIDPDGDPGGDDELGRRPRHL